MNRNISTILFGLLLATILTWAAPPHAEAAHHEKEKEKTTMEDVKKEAGETYATFKRFTVQQRDEALKTAEKKLERIDARIDKAEKKLEDGWNKMTLSAYHKRQQALKALRRQRTEVAEWYGGIQHSSAEAWEEVKKGFSESFDRLERSFEKAGKEFDEKPDKKSGK